MATYYFQSHNQKFIILNTNIKKIYGCVGIFELVEAFSNVKDLNVNVFAILIIVNIIYDRVYYK